MLQPVVLDLLIVAGEVEGLLLCQGVEVPLGHRDLGHLVSVGQDLQLHVACEVQLWPGLVEDPLVPVEVSEMLPVQRPEALPEL